VGYLIFLKVVFKSRSESPEGESILRIGSPEKKVPHPTGGLVSKWQGVKHVSEAQYGSFVIMKLKHYDYDGRARFVTICTHKRMPVFTNDEMRHTLISALAEIRNRFNLKLIAYVIMPEHLHLIVVPTGNDSIGFIVGEYKRITARKIHELMLNYGLKSMHDFVTIRNRKERFALWLRRCYDHNIRSEESLWQKVAYCHNNPVKRGLAKTASEYIWSSCRYYCGFEDALLEIDEIA